ncbi:Gustatory receptor 4c [Ladona fulva]|uniref:Gustatory receptor n=1 Tax=Ladona fulva TaxID=123851 RepID=A0A8K0KKY2_LADFU|nr:Gustatory receptor 4c [Ladona fulva]
MKNKRDLLWAMSPMLIINTFSGIQPFSLERGSSQRRVFFAFNCATFAVLFCFTSYLTVIMPLDTKFFSEILDLSAIVRITWGMFILSSAALSGCMQLVRKDQIRCIFKDLADLVKDHLKNEMVFYRKFILLQVFLFFINTSNLIVLSWKSVEIVDVLSTNLCNAVMATFWTSIHLEQEMQFYNFLYLLSRCTRSMNIRLAALTSFVTSGSRLQRGGDTCVLRQLFRLKLFQMDLYKTQKSAKRVYGFPNLLLVMNNLLNSSFVLYSIFDYGIFIFNGRSDTIMICSIILWTCFVIFIMLSIVSASENLRKEVERTEKLVIDAMLKVEDYPVRRELRLFALQLLHTPFRSSACGFFPLELTLFTSMTATVVTYLVILVQFKGSE